MSTAIGLWRDMILRVMSGVRSAVCGRLGVGWAWPSSANTCMQQVGTMGVPRCRLWRGERERGEGGGVMRDLGSTSRYDPHVNKWTEVAPMAKRRAGVGVVALNGYLYAVGGFDDASPLDTVER